QDTCLVLRTSSTQEDVTMAKSDPQPAEVIVKEWTVAIYMFADGPSGDRALDAVAQRELAGIINAANAVNPASGRKAIEDINVVVQADLHGQNGLLRMVVGGDCEVVHEQNTATPKALNEFVEWAVKKARANHYLVLFWGHSSGVVGLFGERDK